MLLYGFIWDVYCLVGGVSSEEVDAYLNPKVID